MTEISACLWCGDEFAARTAGPHRKKFCSSPCKDGYNAALRRWAQQQIDAGKLSLDELRTQNPSYTTNKDELSASKQVSGSGQPGAIPTALSASCTTNNGTGSASKQLAGGKQPGTIPTSQPALNSAQAREAEPKARCIGSL